MRFGSVSSGIEAASVAFNPLGWEAAWFSEIAAYPSKLLATKYPTVPNLGDMTTLPARIRSGEVEAPDFLCGGTPCQAFSVAGNRRSLDDTRGNLTLKFVEIANAIDDIRRDNGKEPAIVFWENVPGVLNTKDNAFGCFLGALSGGDCELQPPRKKWEHAGCVFGQKRSIAWRILDSQYFGLAQRRKRVFVVASARDGFYPEKILFESESVPRDFAPGKQKGDCIAGEITGSAFSGGAAKPNFELETVVPTMVSDGDAHSGFRDANALVVSSYSLAGNVIVRKPENGGNGCGFNYEIAPTLTSCDIHGVASKIGVRRLTPTECERLMGFPDGYTAIQGASDSARYKALGNSWAVPVVHWIVKRIDNYTKGLI